MHINEAPTPSEPLSVPSEVPHPPKLFRKRSYFVIGLIAVAAVASTFTLVYLLPRGEAATVPLGLNYSVGEKMTYEITFTASAMGQTESQTGTLSMEVLDFDGLNYTIRETVLFQSQEFSYTIKMNKTGHIIDLGSLSPEFEQIYSSFVSMPGYGSYFPKEEAKVGEGWQIPIDIHADGFSLEGTVNFGISGITSITVPAGTYHVFKMDITAPNIQGAYEYSGVTVNLVASMNGYGYLENGTCRPIEFNIQESVTGISMGKTISMSMTMRMQLIEHVK